ncbi:MAG: hypothetical protein H6720_30945 [Sandaracinus sp.]|nr:hypothetical protein [Sandaracinus sp.]
MIDRETLLRRWTNHFGFYGPDDPVDADSLPGAFADLRGAPDVMRRLLDGVPEADELVARFRHLVEASGDGVDHERKVVDMYAVVRSPKPVDRAWAEERARAAARSYAALTRELGGEVPSMWEAPESIRWLAPDEQLEITEELEDIEGEVEEAWDAMNDGLRRAARPHPAWVLREAAYTFAASYPLMYFLLWPIVRVGGIRTEDPFRPTADLWRVGLGWGETEDGLYLAGG